jgi:hypothetical protein
MALQHTTAVAAATAGVLQLAAMCCPKALKLVRETVPLLSEQTTRYVLLALHGMVLRSLMRNTCASASALSLGLVVALHCNAVLLHLEGSCDWPAVVAECSALLKSLQQHMEQCEHQQQQRNQQQQYQHSSAADGCKPAASQSPQFQREQHAPLSSSSSSSSGIPQEQQERAPDLEPPSLPPCRVPFSGSSRSGTQSGAERLTAPHTAEYGGWGAAGGSLRSMPTVAVQGLSTGEFLMHIVLTAIYMLTLVEL